MGTGTAAFERWNTHFSTYVEQEVLGVTLRLAQDPNSEHVGTTVWDASIVLAKYFEKNIRKGDFSRPKVTGKRAVELGAGMGLAGLAFALLGAEVLLTDVKEVLPLLRRNYENNVSPAALKASGSDSHLSSCGGVTVAELDWSQPQHYSYLRPPTFDYILAADCIYHETLLRHLYRVMLAVTTERSTVIIANERRSESVQDAFMQLFSHSFTFKKVPLAKQDPDYSHPAIELYILRKKKGASDANLAAVEAKEAADQAAEAATGLGDVQQLADALPQLSTEPAQQQQQQQPQLQSGQQPQIVRCKQQIAHHHQQQQQRQAANEQLQQHSCGNSSVSKSCQTNSSEQMGQQQKVQRQHIQDSQLDSVDGDSEQHASSAATAAVAIMTSHDAELTCSQEQQQAAHVDASQADSGLCWAIRRQGAQAARLLAGITVPR